MKLQYLTIALTITNASLLVYSLAVPRYSASAQEIPAVLRGRALEIVDDRGRVRAEFKVFPAQPNLKMADGTTGYPETVLLRLITSEGSPNVKLSTLEDGSGLVLGGEKGYVQVYRAGAIRLSSWSQRAGESRRSARQRAADRRTHFRRDGPVLSVDFYSLTLFSELSQG